MESIRTKYIPLESYYMLHVDRIITWWHTAWLARRSPSPGAGRRGRGGSPPLGLVLAWSPWSPGGGSVCRRAAAWMTGRCGGPWRAPGTPGWAETAAGRCRTGGGRAGGPAYRWYGSGPPQPEQTQQPSGTEETSSRPRIDIQCSID